MRWLREDDSSFSLRACLCLETSSKGLISDVEYKIFQKSVYYEIKRRQFRSILMFFCNSFTSISFAICDSVSKEFPLYFSKMRNTEPCLLN